jgi:3-isopropylmalate/(R)-2-methylmalate dehydratase small subunit
MDKFTTLSGVAAPLPIVNVDTDMIIPKDYLKTIKRTGLGTGLFAEMRYNEDGSENPDFILNKPAYRNAKILVAGDNFGCGSSREHAPWALLDYGFRAVVSTEIADIFRNNALKNGLVPIVVDAGTHRHLLDNPGIELDIDVARSTVTLPDGQTASFPLDGFARHCLLEGIDQLGYLCQQLDAVRRFEDTRPWTP